MLVPVCLKAMAWTRLTVRVLLARPQVASTVK